MTFSRILLTENCSGKCHVHYISRILTLFPPWRSGQHLVVTVTHVLSCIPLGVVIFKYMALNNLYVSMGR